MKSEIGSNYIMIYTKKTHIYKYYTYIVPLKSRKHFITVKYNNKYKSKIQQIIKNKKNDETRAFMILNSIESITEDMSEQSMQQCFEIKSHQYQIKAIKFIIHKDINDIVSKKNSINMEIGFS